jgi:hypothetical protein
LASLQVDPQYVAEVIEKLTSSPTAQDMDYLVQAYTTLGYYAATVQGEADFAEAQRKYAEAEAIKEAKESDPKTPQTQLEAIAAVKAWEYRRAEIKARTNAKKLTNLWLSVEQAINAVKFLERNTSVRMGA